MVFPPPPCSIRAFASFCVLIVAVVFADSATSVDFLSLQMLQILQLLLLFLGLLLFVIFLFLAAAFSDVVVAAAVAGRPWAAPEVAVSLSLAVLLAARPAFEKRAHLSSPVPLYLLSVTVEGRWAGLRLCRPVHRGARL